MPEGLAELIGFTAGLYLPDAGMSTPQNSLSVATNVDVLHDGTVKQRPGTTKSDVDYDTFQYAFIHDGDTPYYVVLETDGTGDYFAASGETLGSVTTVTGAPVDVSGHSQMLRSAATTSDPDTYVASKTSGLYRFNGSTFTAVANSPKCRYIAECGWAERMMAVGFDAGATNGPNASPVDGSTVYVSDVSEPESWTTDYSTEIDPGKYGDVTAIASYNSQTFVFKERAFYVFYGESDSGGAVELLFNARTGVGCIAPGYAIATPVGVFFLGADGIYLTTGGTAVRVSDAVGGLFSGIMPSWSPYDRFLPQPDTEAQKTATANGRVYFALDAATGSDTCRHILSYDWETKAWGYYEYNALSIDAIVWPGLSYPLMIGVGDQTTFSPVAFHPLVRTDATATSATSWMPVEFQSAWMKSPSAQGYVGMDKASIHRLDAWGAGIYQASTTTDYNSQLGATKTLDFGDMAEVASDVWGDGSDPLDVWGDGSDSTDVWGDGFGSETDLLRLQPPVHRYLFNLNGRGNWLALRFTKSSASTYVYLMPPRATLQRR